MSASMAEGWSRELAAEVSVRLDVLDQVAAGVASVRVDPDTVRAEIAALVASWRRLLELHSPDEHTGRCRRCPRSWRGRKPWPCGVWRSAHELLVARQDIAPVVVCAGPGEEPPAAPLPEPPAAPVLWETDPCLGMPLRVRVSGLPAQPGRPRSAARLPAGDGMPAADSRPLGSSRLASGTPGPASPSDAEVVAGGAGPRHEVFAWFPVAADDPPDRSGIPGPVSPPHPLGVVEAGPGPGSEDEMLAYGRHAWREPAGGAR